jgi:aspartate/methionine/tyrosine aminotransferase
MFSARTQWDLRENRLSQALSRRQQARQDVFDLTQSNPTACGLRPAMKEVLQALGHPENLRYQPSPKGRRETREVIAALYAQQGVAINPEQIFLVSGTSDAYGYLFCLLADAGDRILAMKPGYPLFDTLAGLQGLRVDPLPLRYCDPDGWALSLPPEEALTAGARAVVLVHPNNPTGSYIKEGERERLNELASRHSLSLVVDEVFSDYAWAPAPGRVQTFAGNREALTFTLNGISKMLGLPQMKLGWIVISGPGALQREALARLEVIGDSHLAVSSPPQFALAAWLSLRESFQAGVLRRLRANRQQAQKICRAVGPGMLLKAEGGWYSVLEVPASHTDEEWAIHLLERHGVFVHPGYLFDFSQEAHLVVSLLTPEAELALGLAALGSCLEAKCAG